MPIILRYIDLLLALAIIAIGLVIEASNRKEIKYLTHEVTNFEVVIARYNEDLAWITQHLPNEKIITLLLNIVFIICVVFNNSFYYF